METIEIVIDEKRCRACGYCVQFCPRGCLKTSEDKMSQLGYAMPVLTNPEQCNTCGLCARMCPHWAINVYLVAEAQGQAIVREKVAGPPKLALAPPLAHCPGCQRPTLGRIIAELLDELGLGGQTIAFDAINCGAASAFDMDFGHVLGPYDRPTDIAIAAKHAHPDAIVLVVQDTGEHNINKVDSFMNGLTSAENITIIGCNLPNYGPWPKSWHLAPANTGATTPEGRELMPEKYSLHTAELAATFTGVAYSARGALTSPYDYELTKSYIKTALQKQITNTGFSFVEVLSACFSLSKVYEASVGCLEWIKENMVAEFPLGEFKNVDRVAQKRQKPRYCR